MTRKYKFEELTKLEQAALKSLLKEETGYIYFDECDIPTKQLRGVMSSLEKKGIIEMSYDQPFEAYFTDEYEDWFEDLDS